MIFEKYVDFYNNDPTILFYFFFFVISDKSINNDRNLSVSLNLSI